MKNTMKQIIATLAFISLLRTGYSQGQLSLDNLHNDSQSPSATSNGLFWISTGGAPALLNQDINAVFYIGTNANNLPVFATFLLSNGTAMVTTPSDPAHSLIRPSRITRCRPVRRSSSRFKHGLETLTPMPLRLMPGHLRLKARYSLTPSMYLPDQFQNLSVCPLSS